MLCRCVCSSPQSLIPIPSSISHCFTKCFQLSISICRKVFSKKDHLSILGIFLIENKMFAVYKRVRLFKKQAFIGLGSGNNIQTERSIFEYANWPRLQAKRTGPSSWSVQLVRTAGPSSWSVHLIRPADPSSRSM